FSRKSFSPAAPIHKLIHSANVSHQTLGYLTLLFCASAIQFTKEPKSQDALHGRSAMLRCEVSDPTDITYSWLHNRQSLENTERRFQEGSNLKFTAVDRRLDAGNFECVAMNAGTGEFLQSTNASFNIKCECFLSGDCTLDPCQTADRI
uniref:Ig-like domain-containing protein n=1 Tax=Cynoglossus semilaevis TaxID=244447 RepID=A0A3P8WCU4_CYNSE